MALLTTMSGAEVLSAEETKWMTALLRLFRSGDERIRIFAEQLASVTNHRLDAEGAQPVMIAYALAEALDNTSCTNGILYLHDSETLYPLTSDEGSELAEYLDLRRSGDWLGDFFKAQLTLFAGGERRTPRQVVVDLESYLLQFDARVKSARALRAEHPAIFSRIASGAD